ncbi:MAG: hypothetical protein K9J37_08345 [Saprospiraceae bacterium]|nr:hypothetical protein [Saprospiraceae bacterium]MCF8249910.1 hypothetical protein [Saprospiraceae bacterium]MCF8279323.1 hypothetical protein [Bacteroidales bacterium]MCF8310014.1 hypothetical protein [Saprospiraceae bacterium]MCF8438914.1 hypothetical protein [Saprospiraceae bacterium]
MEELKQHLKSVLIDDLPQLFKQLKELLLVSSAAYNETIQQEARYNQMDTEKLAGRVSADNANLVFNQITASVTKIIDSLEPQDLKSAPSVGQGLHDYHRFTCDRVDQSDKFQQIFREKNTARAQFFYLYGLDLQSHKGMFKRIAFDMEGKLQDYLNPGLKSGNKSLQVELTFDASRDLEIYKQNVIKNLFSAFSIRVNENEPLLKKDIAWLQKISPVLQALGDGDFVCIFIGVSQWDWDKEITPTIFRWFVTEFCGVALPDNSPDYLFFFGIIYEEDNSQIEKEVEALISQSDLIQPLPELGMVRMNDIGTWFNKYSFIAPGSRELKELRNQYFGSSNEHYMEDVELALQKLIDEYNKKFF